eukprot:GHRQ01010860.1.p3 GENE.GHRQ01010860.1~~GHRQ01010860.1.p3  ORF type:complete len:103 (+),score=19.60 GHRQ01010860.1:347-655(+)
MDGLLHSSGSSTHRSSCTARCISLRRRRPSLMVSRRSRLAWAAPAPTASSSLMLDCTRMALRSCMSRSARSTCRKAGSSRQQQTGFRNNSRKPADDGDDDAS